MSEKSRVAAVCGREVLVFGPVGANGRRPLEQRFTMHHRGDALQYAEEFDATEKRRVAWRPQ